MNKILIYLDNCCFNRPHDVFNNISIYLEAESKLMIQNLVQKNEIELVWSYILEFENSENPSHDIKKSILEWKNIAKIDIVENDNILKKAKKLISFGLGVKDSLHIACAIDAKCDYFITTDKGIIKKSNKIPNIKILNPITFIQLIEDEL